MSLNSKQRFDNLTPLQQTIVRNLVNRIYDCEGTVVFNPSWCLRCQMLYTRSRELFLKFERMNMRAVPKQSRGFDPHGFSDPDMSWP